MGNDKQGSRGGNYVGGFLQMFDWNAKSRNKLFSSKSDIPEQSKKKRRCDGNLPITRLHMLDADETAAGESSVKGSSDQSCSSSVIEEDFYGMRAPGVVARLMGLDSLPKSSMAETNSALLFDPHSLCESLEYRQSQVMHSSNLQTSQKVIHGPIEKFQTEILPPKSAKSIPITHHKLVSPIKSATFIPHKDAAQIMEAAARIIEPGHHERPKAKQPVVGSSSVPLRIRDLKEKVQAAQKPSKILEGSQRKAEFSAIKNVRGQSICKNWNGSKDAAPTRVVFDTEESSVGVKNKGKSISLAILAKANIQRREGLNVGSTRNLISQREPCELGPDHLLKSQSMTQKSMLKKLSRQKGSRVLQQNNQKQNCIVDRGKSPSKCNAKGGKTLSGESFSAIQRNSGRVVGTSKVSTRRLSSEVKQDTKREALSSSTERVNSKKRSVDGNYHSAQNMEMEKNGKATQSRDFLDRQHSRDQDCGRMGTDAISFTFNAPMTRWGHGSWGEATEAGETKILPAGYQSKSSLLSLDSMKASRFSYHVHNVKGGDALSILLEKKLKVATDVEFSQQKLHDSVTILEDVMSSTMVQGRDRSKDQKYTDNQEPLEEMTMSDCNTSQARKLLDCQLPSPVSVLGQFSFADSCNSLNTANSNSTAGSKLCSSIQTQEVLDSLNMYLSSDGDAELSGSASSASVRRQETTTLTFIDSGSPQSLELEYVKEMLCNIELMFEDYALGIAQEIISPHLFDQLARSKQYFSDGGDIPVIHERALFDCVSECLDMKCKQYVSGGYRLWVKGLSMIRRTERLAGEVYKEIWGWSDIGSITCVHELYTCM